MVYIQLHKHTNELIMKSFLKIIKWIAIGIASTITITLSCFVYYLETSIDKVMTKERQDLIISQINNSPNLPKRFYDVYNKYYSDSFDQGVLETIFREILGLNSSGCLCKAIYYHPGYFDKYKHPRFAHIILALEVEERCSPVKCLEYELSISYYGNNIRGIKKASEFYYNRPIEELTDREIISLIIIPTRSVYYSPRRNPENLRRAINRVMNKN